MQPIQTTDPTEHRVPAWADARDQMIHACALQEHIIANAPVLPAKVTVKQRLSLAMDAPVTDEPDVQVYIYNDAEGVAAFGRFLKGVLTHQPCRLGNGEPGDRVMFSGSAYGAEFAIWTMVPVTASTVGAAA